MYQAEHFLTVRNRLGEGALWNEDEQKLYWLDIKAKCFQRINPTTMIYQVFDVGAQIGVMAFRQSGGLVMATDQGFVFWDPRTRMSRIVANPLPDKAYMRFNDGEIDIMGRFWAASMCDPSEKCSTPEGVLYRLDPDGSVHVMDTGLSLPNGMVWSPDQRTLYLTDSTQHMIYTYDFDAANGTIGPRRPFISTANEPGVPDGLSIDSEGFLWSMRYNGAKITRYDPRGNVERIIHVPAQHPTSCAFGGPDLDDLYITTAWDGLSSQEIQQTPQAGDLFHIKTGIKGTVRRKFAG